MKFEKATEKDIAGVWEILKEAKRYLAEQGIDQWQRGGPTRNEVENCVKEGTQFLVREGGAIAGVCTVVEGDSDYLRIDGAWRAEGKYFAVHRVAVARAFRGSGVPARIYEEAEKMAKAAGCVSLRADTHQDNARMRATFVKNGFRYCGRVFVEGGEERLAFDRLLDYEQTKRVLVVATGNRGKLAEIRQILPAYEVLSAREAGFLEDVEETGTTFRENALIKAQAVSRVTGLPALADDSGLCVNALGGAPGIYSARYSGKGEAGNRALLIKNMQGVEDRTAYFACSLALCKPNGEALFAEGRTYGKILYEEQGSNGFGYDPLFYSDDLKKSFALATNEEKNAVSHRGRALAQMEKLL